MSAEPVTHERHGPGGYALWIAVAVEGELGLRDHRDPSLFLKGIFDQPLHLARVFDIAAEFFQFVLAEPALHQFHEPAANHRSVSPVVEDRSGIEWVIRAMQEVQALANGL